MTAQQGLSSADYDNFCRRCKHYSANLHQGILCGITHAKPSFIGECKNFILDSARALKVKIETDKSSRLEASTDNSFFASEKKGIKKGVVGGLAMMAIAAIWFVVGYQAGYIFFYPPILFLIGLYAFFKGIFTGNISGEEL